MRAGLTAVDGEATLLPEGENGPPCGSRVLGAGRLVSKAAFIECRPARVGVRLTSRCS
jgi:hypothetical protein